MHLRPHRSTIRIDVAYCCRWSRVDWSVSMSVTIASPTKTAEPIEMSFGAWISNEACVRWGVHWRNLANTTEPSVCGGDDACL